MKTVAIVGSHPLSRGDFDFNRTDCEIWVFNEAMASTDWCKRATAVFQMHDPIIWKNPLNRNDPGHAAWLMSGDTPTIYMKEKYQEVPKAVKYPLDEVIQLLGLFNYKHYLTSSVAQAIALAILQGFERIELYGIGMESETEYFYQRDCVSFWVGYALGHGIEVDAHKVAIFDTLIYGYEGNVTIDKQTFETRMLMMEPEIKLRNEEYGAVEEKCKDALGRFAESPTNTEEVVALIKQLSILAGDFGFFDGSRQENLRYLKKIAAMQEATGGQIISRQEYEHARATYANQHQMALAQSQAFSGRLNAMLEEAKHTENKVRRRARMQKFSDALTNYVKMTTAVGMYAGAAEENHNYLITLDKMIRAAGGEKSREVMEAQHGEVV